MNKTLLVFLVVAVAVTAASRGYGYDENNDGLNDRLDRNRDGRADYGYGRRDYGDGRRDYGLRRGVGGYGYGVGAGYDENRDGLSDRLDRNRDGHADYGYGRGYGSYGRNW